MTRDGAAIPASAPPTASGPLFNSSHLGQQLAAAASMRPLIHLGRLNEALEMGGRIPNPGGPAWRPMCLAYAGQANESQVAIEQFLAASRIGEDKDETPCFFLAVLLEGALLSGDGEHADWLSKRLEPLAGLAATQENTVCVARLLGGAAALLGEPERATAYYEQALGVAGRVGNRPEVALTHLQMAELLLDSGSVGAQPLAPLPSREEALSHLDFAIAEFREMKMQPALGRALRHKEVLKA